MSASVYRYRATDVQGRRRTGVIEAGGRQDAFRKLASQGLTPVMITEGRAPTPLFSFQKITTADIADLTRELSVLVEAKIPIGRGLLSVADHEAKPALRSMVRDIATQVESGASMTDAISRHREVFGEVYIESMRAAEKTGCMAMVTSNLADMLERQIESRQQLKRAMTYPIIVISVILIAISVLVVFVIPKFAATFAAHGVELPLITRVLLGAGNSVRAHWWAYALGGISVTTVLLTLLRTGRGRLWFEGFLSKSPGIGPIIVSVTAGRFARVLAIGLASGLDIIESLEMGGRATGRTLFVRECDQMSERLRRGDELGDVLATSRYLPSFARRMLSAGKDSTELSRASGIVARHYDREAGHLTKNINALIEPVMTIGMAVVVLIVALSVFLPMWQMVRLKH